MALFRGEIILDILENRKGKSTALNNLYFEKIKEELQRYGDDLLGFRNGYSKPYNGIKIPTCLEGFSLEEIHSYSAGNIRANCFLFGEKKKGKNGLAKLTLVAHCNNGRELESFFENLQKTFPEKTSLKKIGKL